MMTAGDRIKKRGSSFEGTIAKVSKAGWITIEWDDGVAPRIRPLICTAKELEPV